jgi:hypothetical protein
LSVLIRFLASCLAFASIHPVNYVEFASVSVLFTLIRSITYLLSDYSVLFSGLILEMYSRYCDPHINNHPAVNKHHITRLHHFLSQYRKQEPINIIDISGISGNNFSNWVSRGQEIVSSSEMTESRIN